MTMKKMYVCKDHHRVLLPWAWTRRSHQKLNLLTLDHHTDTIEAFCHYLYHHKDEALDELIAQIDFHDDAAIRRAIAKLRNDEHIDTAIRCGILQKAFVISYAGMSDNPPSNEFTEMTRNVETFARVALGQIPRLMDRTYPDANLYTVGTDGYLSDENGVSDEFLKMMLSKASTMGGFDIMQTEFILDIDLDYFHSYESFKRSDLTVFRHLLSAATAITIATEPDFAYRDLDSDKILIDPEIILAEVITLAKEEIGDEFEIINLR